MAVSALNRFYYKVQSKVLSLLCTEGLAVTDVIVMPWDVRFWYLSWDRVAFYLIPDSKFFLRDSFKKEVSDVLYSNDKFPFFSMQFDLKLEQIQLTGRQQVLSTTDSVPLVGIELSNSEWLIQSKLDLFPKQVLYCRSRERQAPIFIFSDLKIPLGGVWPLKEQIK